MIYGKDIPAKLTDEVAQEAAFFHLPPDWREGREAVQGYVVDERRAKTADDAVYANSHPDGGHTLSVSVADLGSFLAAPSGMRTLARARGYTQRDRQGVYPLWPREVTTHYLSLKPDVDRPTITTHIPFDPYGRPGEPQVVKGIITADVYTRDHFDTIVHEAEDGAHTSHPFIHLAKLVGLLQAERLRRTPHSEMKFPEHTKTSTRLLTEVLYAHNQVMGRFMLTNNIPALYRTSKQEPHEVAVLSATPDTRAESYVRTTSPLRRFADFVCQANIVAYLDDEPYPFDEAYIDSIVAQYNSRKHAQKVPVPAKAQALHDRILDGSIEPKDIVQAFTLPEKIMGSAKIRRAAFEHAIADPARAERVISLLLTQGMLKMRQRHAGEKVRSNKVLEDAQGNCYPYGRNAGVEPPDLQTMTNHVRQNRDTAHTLAQFAGLQATPELPWHLSKAAPQILWAPAALKAAGVNVRYVYDELPDGAVHATAVAQHEGKEYSYEATEKTERLAASQAAHKLLGEALPEYKELQREQRMLKQLRALDPQHGHGARHYLDRFLQSFHRDGTLARLEYAITETTEGTERMLTCEMSFEHQGIIHTITVTEACGRKVVKEIAALHALEALEAPILARLRK